MALLLQILGGIALFIILFVVGFFFYLKFKFGKYLSIDDNRIPLIIHLNEDFSKDKLMHKDAGEWLSQLCDKGFKQGKSFSIQEMPAISITAFYAPPYSAVLYHHDQMGFWIDVVLESVEGGEYTVTNSPLGEAAEHRPEKFVSYQKEANLSQMMEVLARHYDPSGDYVILSDQNFRDHFEKTYRKDMAFTARNGGISYEEFLGHAAESGIKVSDDDQREAYIETKLQELHQWHDAAMELFHEGIDKERREQLEESGYQLFIVPFTTDAAAFIRYLDYWDFFSEEISGIESHFEGEHDTFQLFDKINASRSPDLRAEYVSEKDYPLPLKLYRQKV